MKKIFCSLVFFFAFTSVIYSQITPINMPEVYDNSIALPKSAEEGFNMFTDNNFTTLKSPYAEKIAFVKDYEKKLNDYMAQTTDEGRAMLASNDPILKDTSMEPMNRKIIAMNLDLLDVVTNELTDIGMAQVEFTDEINNTPDNKEKIRKLNAYISGKYADITNKYAALLREKLLLIYPVFQEINFGADIRNPLTRMTVIVSLYNTVDVYVNRRNQAAFLTAQRLAKDYAAYKN